MTADGEETDVKHTVEQGRYDNYRIGEADTTLSIGPHEYVLEYHVTVLTPGGEYVDTDTQFYWNLIPAGWAQDIQRSELTVHLPEPADEVRCWKGVGEVGDNGTSECKVQGTGTTDLTVRTKGLNAHTPVTIVAGQDMPTPDQATLPWPARFDNVFGTSVPVLLVFVGLAVLLGGLGLLSAGWPSSGIRASR